MDTTTVHGLLVFCGFGLEITISSNMGDYLLPAAARRPAALSPLRDLSPAAGPGVATAPCWPRQRFHATTRGAAMPKLEDVPTTIPTTRTKDKPRSSWPPITNRTST